MRFIFLKKAFREYFACLRYPIVVFITAYFFMAGCTGERSKAQDAIRRIKELDNLLIAQPDMGLRLADTLIREALNYADTPLVINLILKKASWYQSHEMPDSAITYYRKALIPAGYLRNDSLLARCYNGLANHYLRKEDYRQATHFLVKALEKAERAGYWHMKGLIHNGLGLVSISMKKQKEAIAHFQKALEICRQSRDTINMAGISMNIAGAWAELQEFEKAKAAYTRNLLLIRKTGDTSQIILALINLGIVNRHLGRTDDSFVNLEAAFDLLKYYPDRSLFGTALLEMGSVNLAEGNLRLAAEYFRQTIRQSAGTLNRSNTMEALARLSAVEEKLGNDGIALQYFRQYTLIKDSVMNDETRRSIAEIQFRYDLQKKEYDNELLRSRILQQRKRAQFTWLLLGFILVVVLLIALLFWLSHKNLRKSFHLEELKYQRLRDKLEHEEVLANLEKLRLQSELESRNRELSSVSLQLVAKNKVLGEIHHRIARLYDDGKLGRETFKGLEQMVNDNLNTDREWEQFKGLFDKVHSGFFSGLKEQYPDLSEHELRLCAYLRINLRNKEISRILNVSPGTVNTTRYRIRKKMKLEPETSLEDYLRSL